MFSGCQFGSTPPDPFVHKRENYEQVDHRTHFGYFSVTLGSLGFIGLTSPKSSVTVTKVMEDCYRMLKNQTWQQENPLKH